MRFRDFALELDRYELRRSGEFVHLTPKAMELLILLVANRPRMMTRDELADHLWPDVIVVPANLRNLVAEIRAALNDQGRELLRTIHGRGYAFTDEVIEGISETGPPVATLLLGRKRFPLRPGVNLVGRGNDCEVMIADRHVSRHHARIIVTDEELRIEDLESRNGTFVSDRRITSATVSDGDEIRFGVVSLALSFSDDDSITKPFDPQAFREREPDPTAPVPERTRARHK